jgi:hypothetical protein
MNANDGAGGCWNAGCRDHGVGLKVNGGNLCGYNFQVATEGFLGRHATDTLLNYRYGAANDTEGSKNAWGTLMLNRFALPVAVKNALTHIVANTAQGSSSTHYFDSAGCGLLSSTALAGRSVCSNGISVFTENLWSPISLFAEDDSKLSGRLVNFALDPSKEKQLVQWFGSEATPLLVWDPTHSGKIVDGSQLFGSFTFGKSWSDGYKALASIDVNGDGELSGGELEPLGVWVDRNQDAVSQDGEVLKVSEFGVLRIFVVSDLEQPDIEKGLIWAKKGYVRKTEDGTEKVLPTVDWFTPSGGASAHLAPLLGERVPERAVGGVHFSKEVQEPATIESSSATDLSKSVSNLNSEKEIDFWYFTLGDEDSKGVNDGGWLALQRGADGKIFATSVVVAPLRSNDSGVGHAAFSQKMEGVEKVNLNGVRELSFGGRILSGDDSGVELSSKALVSLDGRQMSGETSQRPFGKSSGRSMTYSWRAFRMVDKQG